MPKSSAVRVPASSPIVAWRRRREPEVVKSTAIGTFLEHPSLAVPLPPLVRKQRRLEAKIAPLSVLVEEEKACRAEIDVLLVAAGIAKGKGVTCAGYDIAHVERVNKRLDQDVLVLKLVEAGLAKERVFDILAESTEIGDPFTWATVKPSKGAKVRA